MGEFELIRHCFARRAATAPVGDGSPVVLGIGDDAALLRPTPGMLLAVSTDMLVQGRHFFADVDPCALGHKTLAVNLSDMAAMGARPLGFTLALALPQADEAWLDAFADGLFTLAEAHGCALVGGDTTAGPLTLSVTIWGELPPDQALRRDAARVGDDVYVSGWPGEARLALDARRGLRSVAKQDLGALTRRLERPTPRVALGLALRGRAHAAADVSDGLVADLGHILQASGVGATLHAQALWDSPALGEALRAQGRAAALELALAGGDDYELVFTAPPARRAELAALAGQLALPLTRLGSVDATQGCRVLEPDGGAAALELRGFDHFA